MERANEEQRNREMGNPGDVDFQRMIRQFRLGKEAPVEQVLVGKNECNIENQLSIYLFWTPKAHIRNLDNKICICIRKRPISSKEVKKNDYDSVTCLNPVVVVHGNYNHSQ